MTFFKYFFLFLVINFGALTIGSWLMNNGPQTLWYTNLNKAPWSPPGWLFGVAWTTIMLCFSVYMASIKKTGFTRNVIILFSIQFVLNVIWNYIFFNKHLVGLALISILLLTIVVGILFFYNLKTLKAKSLFILPYGIWLCLATSLNAYILIYN